MKLRRILSFMMALLLVCSFPVSVFAAEYDLAQGSVIVNATETGQTVTHGSNAAVADDAPVITQSNSSTPTTNTVTITAAADTAKADKTRYRKVKIRKIRRNEVEYERFKQSSSQRAGSKGKSY